MQEEGSTTPRSSSTEGYVEAWLQGPRVLGVQKVAPLVVLCYYLGKVKSHEVSCAHFHMACIRRVKPMSLGFSRPLISRCFMMETNSLLLSSPLPRGRSKHNSISGGLGTTPLRKFHQIPPFAHHVGSKVQCVSQPNSVLVA